MICKRGSFSRLIMTLGVCGLAVYLSGGRNVISYGQTAAAPPVPSVDDWSHHYLVFSNPGTYAGAVQNGKAEHWVRITNDPRYKMQQLKRSRLAGQLATAPDFAARAAILNNAKGATPDPIAKSPKPAATVKKDWSEGMGGFAASVTGAVGTLSSTSITGSSNLVVGGVTLTASAPTAASQTGTFSSPPSLTNAITVTNTGNSNTLTLKTNATLATYTFTFSGEENNADTLQTVYNPGTGVTLAMSGASSGSGTCTGSGTSYSGSFTYSSSDSAEATSFYNAVNACHTAFPVVGVTVPTAPTGSSVTLQADLPGPFLTVTDSLRRHTGDTMGGGVAGSASCTSSTTAYYETSNSMSTLAGYLAAGVNACSSYTATTGINNNAGSSSGNVTIYAVTPGTGANGSTFTLAPTTTGFFKWNAGGLASGADGTQSGATSGTTATFAYWSVNNYLSQSSVATNIAAALNDNTTFSANLTATANSPATDDVTITANAVGSAGNSYTLAANSFSAFTGAGALTGGATGTVQPSAYPAKFSFNTGSASCANDFVVYPTGVAGTSASASIVAYNNLYVGSSGANPCETSNPTVLWAYNTGGTVTTSPILSGDGSQVAFIQVSGTTASLVLLKWKSSTGESVGSPGALNTASGGSNYNSGCSLPCVYTIAFGNSKNDTYSSPFYDYTDDILYVGDDSGNLHKFTAVFKGSPVESGNPWPVNLGANKLTSPVYDGGSTHIFVGDMGGGTLLHNIRREHALPGDGEPDREGPGECHSRRAPGG
jgi:hypothetical protein